MVRVFDEVRRVMKPEGTLWLNYGDCYATKPNGRSAAATKAAGKDAVAEHPSFTGVLLGVEGLQCAEGTTTGPAAAVNILVVESC